MDVVDHKAQPVSNGLDHTDIEETTKQALHLKKKELRWKLMQASQVQNLAKLNEIKAEVNYSKDKMKKIATMAAKLRAKFLKLAKASKIAESNYKNLEAKLLTQEKFVADEMMQLTKLSIECRDIGSKLYGPGYELVSSSPLDRTKEKHKLAMKIREAKLDLGNRMIELEKKATIHQTAKKILAMAKSRTNHLRSSSINQSKTTRLSSLYDLSDSFLRNVASFRLTNEFSRLGYQLTHNSYAHDICLKRCICLPDLMSSCTDKNCSYQHKSKYIMSDIEKLTDLLSYMPELTGYFPNPLLEDEENHNQCRLKLKQYAAKLIAKNPNQSIESIAQNLVKFIRANKSDQDLITMTRKLPKISHLIPQEDDTESWIRRYSDADKEQTVETVSIGDTGEVSIDKKDDVIEVIILD